MTRFVSKTLGLAAGVFALTALACSQDGQVVGPDAAMTVTPGPLTIGVTLCKVANDAETVGDAFDFNVSATPSGTTPPAEGVVVDATPNLVAKTLGTLQNSDCQLVWQRFGTAYDDESTITIEEVLPPGYKLAQISFVGAGTTPANESFPADASVTFAPYAGLTVYFKNIQVEETGGEGCTPGGWRNNDGSQLSNGKFRKNWWTSLATYQQGDSFEAIFGVDLSGVGLGGLTLLAALDLNANNDGLALIKHATAALLNANSTAVDYPFTEQEVIDLFNSVWPNGDLNSVKDQFDAANNLGCPQ